MGIVTWQMHAATRPGQQPSLPVRALNHQHGRWQHSCCVLLRKTISKRYVFVRYVPGVDRIFLLLAPLSRPGIGCTFVRWITSCGTVAVQHDQVSGRDFRAVFLLAALAVLPTGGLQTAFDIDLGTLLEILANDLREA